MVPVRRVVVGPGPDGRAAIVFDEASPHVTQLPGMPERLGLTDLWASEGMPPSNTPGSDDAVPEAFSIGPGPAGTLFRVVQFPPAGDGMEPLWHQTDTLDYNTVVSGGLVLMTEAGEVTLGPGECAVVRGIQHAWDNRTEGISLLAAVSIAAEAVDPGG